MCIKCVSLLKPIEKITRLLGVTLMYWILSYKDILQLLKLLWYRFTEQQVVFIQMPRPKPYTVAVGNNRVNTMNTVISLCCGKTVSVSSPNDSLVICIYF